MKSKSDVFKCRPATLRYTWIAVLTNGNIMQSTTVHKLDANKKGITCVYVSDLYTMNVHCLATPESISEFITKWKDVYDTPIATIFE